MENVYGIGTANRYSLFLDNETDPLETLQIKEQEKELKRKTKVVEKENKGKPEAPAKGKPTQPPKKIIKDVPHKAQDNKREDGKLNHQRSTDNKTEKTFNKFNNENREERNNRRNREDRPFNGNFENNREDRPRREGDFDNRRGRAVGSKTAGRGGVAPRRGKREFERQSGSDKTGVKPIDKRDGGGAHNWGSHKDVIEEADANKSTETEQVWSENEKAETSINAEQKETENETENVPVEEEPKELTLDEWKAQRAGRQKPTYNLRKAGEGEDPSQWKKMYELSKKKDGEEEETDDEEYDTSEYPQRVGRQKRVVGIDFHFSDSRRGGAGRGRGARAGRGARNNREGGGGGRGQAAAAAAGGGGGGPSGGEKPVQGGGNRYRPEETGDVNKVDAKHAPKVDDERDFPSLG
ncbi:PREDICTED: plasminogen activator inhibitor 1 RNA-binding protein-like isoform X2 [Nicrophorus vespilloides]|uniref:Plasminogen activator inhibitor 1 RNA-binding protein-like isoform X2 n=2 Tax=Nicrophorus vespilloides TaxID=110193 RepID=A0ABM1MI20_NICVS|nr:PREDICTED: plasminogen activator inhibitor 1 RNA-binding protein-like isoform X2 [Nicrophorus vespilloides]